MGSHGSGDDYRRGSWFSFCTIDTAYRSQRTAQDVAYGLHLFRSDEFMSANELIDAFRYAIGKKQRSGDCEENSRQEYYSDFNAL